MRYCRYNAPDTWVPDTTDTTAGYFNLGTLGLPVVAAARSGIYTVLAKESEIFALDGDFSAEFYPRRIGEAHGPASSAGMVFLNSREWTLLRFPRRGVPMAACSISDHWGGRLENFHFTLAGERKGTENSNIQF